MPIATLLYGGTTPQSTLLVYPNDLPALEPISDTTTVQLYDPLICIVSALDALVYFSVDA